jgi:hypothetical protein
MALLNNTDLEGKFNHASTGLFKANTTGAIGSDDARALVEDLTDSYVNKVEDIYTSYVVSTSGTDTYTATPSPAIAAYITNTHYFIKFVNTNTTAVTLNLNSLGAIAVKKNGSTALGAGDITANQILHLLYDGTNFQIVGSFADGASYTAASFGDFIVGLTGKTTPVDADSIIISDSAAGDDAKKVTLTNTKAFFKTYNDTLYPAIVDTLASNTPVTTGGTITLDCESRKQLIAVGSASFSGSKTIALSNNTNAKVVAFLFQLSGSGTLTMPSTFVMDTGESRWNTGTKVLTLTGAGYYEISCTWDGTRWRVKASADGGYV